MIQTPFNWFHSINGEAEAQRVIEFVEDCQCGLRQTQKQNSGSSDLTNQILKHFVIFKIQRSHCVDVPTQLPFYFKYKRV